MSGRPIDHQNRVTCGLRYPYPYRLTHIFHVVSTVHNRDPHDIPINEITTPPNLPPCLQFLSSEKILAINSPIRRIAIHAEVKCLKVFFIGIHKQV